MVNSFSTIVTAAGLAAGIALGSGAQAQSAFDGMYIGLQVGYGDMESDLALNSVAGEGWWASAINPNNTSFSLDGAVGGFHAGYGATTSGNMYWGIDASYNVAGMSESQVSPAFPGIDTWTLEIDNYWDITGRLGLVRNNNLFYASLGLAGANVDTIMVPPIDASGNQHFGFVIGVGGERIITGNTTLGLEYKYYDFGSANHAFNPACAPCSFGDGREVDVKAHVVNLRLTTRF